MKIGIPREIKPFEGRVALIPAACTELVRDGHEVLVERGAGDNSGFSDADYESRGVTLVADADTLYGEAELVVKVKEPVAEEFPRLRSGHLLFCFLHLAAQPELMAVLRDKGLTAVAFETVAENGHLPILQPMSEVAGHIAAQVGAHLLHGPAGGKGLLLGGMPAARRGRVMVLGFGVVGEAAARSAAALGAEVTVFDKEPLRLGAARGVGANVTALYPFPDEVAEEVARADLLVGAVLVPGARTPHLIDRGAVATMGRGSVIVDVSVDQGGCVETIRPTDYGTPTYVEEGVVHFGVTNMPGAVPRTSSEALSAALARYVGDLAATGWERRRPALADAVNVRGGDIVLPALREAARE